MDAKTKKFIEDMEKKFGVNVLRPASSIKAENSFKVSTGSVGLDIALGGGYPVGRFTQVSGAFSSAKSTVAYHGIGNFQRFFLSRPEFKHLRSTLIQGENGSWTDEYGQSVGIDTDDLLINESASMEEALEVARQLQEREVAGFIAFDSFASFVPMKEYGTEMNESVQMGLKPKLFDEYFRKWQALNNKLSREGKLPVTLLGLNQLREKIGAYGDPEYTPGGRSIGYTASVDIRFRRGEWITIGSGVNKEIIGQQVKWKIHKSKVSVPQKTGMFDIYFEEGGPVPPGHIDTFKETVLEAVAYGVVHQAGAWMTYGDKVKVQGAQKLVDAMRESPELFEEIKAELMNVALQHVEQEFTSLTDEEQALIEEFGTLDPEEIEKEKKVRAKAEKKSAGKKKAKPKGKKGKK